MKTLKAYNTETINRFHQRKVHKTEVVETRQDDPPEPPVPDNDLSDIPESEWHNSEDLDQALQAYQSYQVPCPQDSTKFLRGPSTTITPTM